MKVTEKKISKVFATSKNITSRTCTIISVHNYHCTGTGSCASGTCDGCNYCVDSDIYTLCSNDATSPAINYLAEAPGGSTGGGSAEFDDIVVPDPFEDNDGDLSNPITQLRVKFYTFYQSLGQENSQINNLFTSNAWLSNVLSSYFLQNGFTDANKTNIQNALIKFVTFNDNFYSSNSTYNQQQEFKLWALIYFLNNPSVTLQQFNNWFSSKQVEEEGEFSEEFWNNPNLLIQQQNLPTFESFKSACPTSTTTAQTLCNGIGGEVLTMYNAVVAQNKKLNTCALRISKALNYSGIIIPSLPDNPNGTKNTIVGADGKNYIINAKSLNKWLRKTFGTPTGDNHITNSQSGVKGINFPNLILNKKGIYSMIARDEIQSTWGTGHADLLENGTCLLNCNFYDVDNNFVPVDYIDIWILN
ncbi:T6SS effector amidase Tae4 family protein [Flavobacterium xanthum]|uniref:Type VI secretion system (T6SS), amidase effector protein 4 n=1 Tax=Flavobacterium xanthum TaxID=69322 RepID=A0A1M7GKL0_9FLAO|nr:T6SS effector amidase Tae4 family protein [Flavobacterium xanthum]SHM16944.1 Type VI secretion system (T6SS), amidase effector protein 4 [Flavobacterium xanthum]